MISRFSLITASCVVVFVCGGVVWHFDTKRPQQQETMRIQRRPGPLIQDDIEWVPDEYTRAKAQKLTVQDVNFIRLKGANMGHDGDPSQDIAAPKMIEAFLDALRNAEKADVPASNAADKSDTFEVYLKSHDVWIKPTKFDVPMYCYGPPFQKALVELGKYRADQLHALLRERGDHLKKVTFDVDEKVFRTPEQLKAISAELNALDENAFAYADMDRPIGVQLFFNDAKTQNVYLVLRDWKYHRPDETPKPWPPIIEAYLKHIKKRFVY